MGKSAADICMKLGFAAITSEDYKRFVSNFKRIWFRQQHADLIARPSALKAADKSAEWKTGIRTMYTDFPAQWDLANFVSPAERRDCATHFLMAQTKKVRQDMKEEE